MLLCSESTIRIMDPSPLLPLWVLTLVMFGFITPLTMDVQPRFMEMAQQMLALLWIIPTVIIVTSFVISLDNQNSRQVYEYQQQNDSMNGGEAGPSWGLLGLMLVMLLLLPWRY
ncbi:hypothetical protein R1sor_004301 [Riccia sorocarpa]|uniref:Uncharacterized protein n=1 Tax=Riccia sorocarpa TaxID=122646 RepID=A0ABD3HKM3_9MARC